MSEIATVTAAPDAGLNPRTGEPRRPWSVWASAVLLYLAAADAVAGLLVGFWLSLETFADAAPLHGLALDALEALGAKPDQAGVAAASAGIVAVDFVLMLLVCAGALIAGYYGWRGYAWARWAGVVALGVSLLALLLHPVAWAVPALAALGAGALWLPVSRRFAAAWQAVRHPAPVYPAIRDDVFYGPLDRYRA